MVRSKTDRTLQFTRNITTNGTTVTTTFTYDAEGKLVSAKNGTTGYSVLYDGDGNKISTTIGDIANGTIINGTTTILVGNYYEWTSNDNWKKYYSANGQNIAVRDQTGVQYLYGDNVGSVRGWSNSNGTSYGSQSYMPWGEDGTSTQYGSAGKAISDRKYTGQKSLADLGIYDYQARYYDPYLNRFLQPDSIIPDPYNPLSYDRYAYVNNNPVINNDPTGHCWQCVVMTAGALIGAVAGGAIYTFEASHSGKAYDANFYSGQIGAALDGAAQAALIAATLVGVTEFASQGVAGIKQTAYNLNSDLTLKFGEMKLPNIAGNPENFTKSSKISLDNLPDDALVCRGGECTANRFTNGTGVTINSDGKLSGISVNSASGKSVQELSETILNRQVGVTTVGDIRSVGGNVVPSPTISNPFHANLSGITPSQAEWLFTPTQENPWIIVK